MAKAPVSKAQIIRNYMTANPSATPALIAEALASKGVSLRQVYDIRARTKSGKPASKKATAKKSAGSNSSRSKEAKGGRGRTRPYPQRNLEEALKVPKAIREKNNGRPMDTEQVAKASLGVSKTNTRFFYLAAASRDYGLTIGSRDSTSGPLTAPSTT